MLSYKKNLLALQYTCNSQGLVMTLPVEVDDHTADGEHNDTNLHPVPELPEVTLLLLVEIPDLFDDEEQNEQQVHDLKDIPTELNKRSFRILEIVTKKAIAFFYIRFCKMTTNLIYHCSIILQQFYENNAPAFLL